MWLKIVDKFKEINSTLDLGMDMLKHGESAYPADAWVEQQYMKEDSLELPAASSIDSDISSANNINSRKTSVYSLQSKDGLPPNMKYSRSASYNNPQEMCPSQSKLMTGMTQLAGNIIDFLISGIKIM